MTLLTYLQAHDALFALAMIAALVAAYAASRWLSSYLIERAIQHEKDAMPPLDYSRLRPVNRSVRLASLPELKELEMRAHARLAADAREAHKLRLVVRSSSRGL